MFEYLEKIDNGSLKRAHRMSYEGSIWDAIENGYIYGEEETVDGEVFYKNLSLTKSGKEMLRFSKLTIKDIDNSHGKNSMKEWLLKPLVLESCKFILLAALAFLGSVYSAEIKEWFTSFLKEQTNQVEVNKSKVEK